MPQTEAAACPKHIDLYAVAPHHHALTRAMLGRVGAWRMLGHGVWVWGGCWGMWEVGAGRGMAHVGPRSERMLGHEPRGMGHG